MRLITGVLAIVCCFLLTSYVKGQDIIVTTANDSIRCEVLNQEGKEVVYRYADDASIKKRILSKAYVSTILLNAYEVPVQVVKALNPDSLNSRTRFHFRSGAAYYFFDEGFGITTFKDRPSSFRSGSCFTVDFSFQTILKSNLGILYSRMSAFETEDESKLLSIGTLTWRKDILSQVDIDFIGLNFTRLLPVYGEKHIVVLSSAFGYSRYVNSINSDAKKSYRGDTLGFLLSAGYDQKVSERLALNISLEYAYAHLTTLTEKTDIKSVIDIDKSLNRAHLSLGLSWYPFKEEPQ